MPALSVARIAELCNGEVEGASERLISGANALENAIANELSYVSDLKSVESAASSHAGCLLVPPFFEKRGQWALIRVANPRTAFATAVSALYHKPKAAASIHPTAIIAVTASVGENCFVGAYVTIGERTRVGQGCYIGPGCVIGEDVRIANDAILHPRVTLYDGVQIGARVILHSGCILGADGFGFSLTGDHYEKFPQVGIVEIGDDVEIGANSCVDRAALGKTRIGDGSKLDNLVHVAHNCVIGRHVVVAAQTGFSGSVMVGDYAVIGGQAGIGEKAKIASKAMVGGKSGVLPSQRIRAGEPVWGIPARPLRQHLKGLANIAKLPELREELRQLSRKVAALGRTGEQPIS